MIKKLLKKLAFIKKIKLIHVLLVILILVVFFGLFKTEIRIWKMQNLPRLLVKELTYSDKCTKWINNPEYAKEYQQKYQEAESKSSIKCPSFLEIVNGKKTTLRDEFDCRQKIEKVMGQISASATIPLIISCDKIKEETWFYAFGRYWFKVKDK